MPWTGCAAPRGRERGLRGIHRDETTPHLYAYIVPIDERGRLNCRAFYGGAGALRLMQTDFAERVGRKHGLERGVEAVAPLTNAWRGITR